MLTSRFVFGYLESVCVCPMCYFIDALLQLTLCSSHIFWSGSNTEVVNVKITIDSRCKTPCNTVNFYIKRCHRQNTPLRASLFQLIEIRKRWFDSDTELPIREKTLDEVRQFSSQSKAMETFHYSELPSGPHKPSPDQRRLLSYAVSEYWPLLWRFPIWPHDP